MFSLAQRGDVGFVGSVAGTTDDGFSLRGSNIAVSRYNAAALNELGFARVADYDEYSVPPWLREPSRIAGEASVKFCSDAILAAKAGIVDAIVTAPISTSETGHGSRMPNAVSAQ